MGQSRPLYVILHRLSRRDVQGFRDWFSWIHSPLTRFTGNVTVDTMLATTWTLSSSPSSPFQYSLYLEVSAKAPFFPLTLRVSNISSPYVISFRNHTILSSVPVTLPTICSPSEYNRVCADRRGVTTKLLVTRLHGADQYDIANTNQGDFLGDSFFACTALLQNATVSDGTCWLVRCGPEVQVMN